MSITPSHPATLSVAWSSPLVLSSDNHDIDAPKIAIAPDTGTPIVTWQAGKAIMVSRHDGVTWQMPARIIGGIHPSANFDANGDLHLAFANDYSGRLEIYHTVLANGFWTLPLNVSLTPGASYHPQMAIAPDGSLHLVWGDHSTGYPSIYHGWQRSGWHWDNQAIPNAAGQRPAAVFDAAGRLHVAFQTGDDTFTRGDVLIFAWTRPDGQPHA